MRKKETIKLARIKGSLHPDRYSVVSVTNRMTPKPGDTLSEEEAQKLVNLRDVTVTIVSAAR